MITSNDIWLMESIAANYSSNLGVFSLKSEANSSSEYIALILIRILSDSELLRYQYKKVILH